MQPLLMPPNLLPGQKVRVIAPSGSLREWEQFERGVQIWRDRQYEVYIPANMNQPWGYLAGSDEHRRRQFIEAWNDPDCAAIACARGGYGSMRLLETFDWEDLQPQAKWLIGFSDITALMWGLATHKQIASMHAPVLTTLSLEPDWSVQGLFDWLDGNKTSVTLAGKGWGGGKTSGVLLPGNLNIATHLLGSSLCPDLEGVILAFEDIDELPYKVDRMLTHWRMTGAIAKVAGIALGRFSHKELPPDRPSFTMSEVWHDRLMDLGVPVVVDLPFGHDGTNACLVAGAIAWLDGNTGLLNFNR